MTDRTSNDFTVKDLEIFGRCLAQLNAMLDRYDREHNDVAVRYSVVKVFELTYELAYRTLLKYLLYSAASTPTITSYDFQDLIRKGDQEGLLRTGWPEWKAFREARNKTAHTYREDIAMEVAAGAREFSLEAQVLLERLTRRMKANV